jgi:hypothetical protein
VVFRHAAVTTCTGHDALLVCDSSNKNRGSVQSSLDPKEVLQMKGDVRQESGGMCRITSESQVRLSLW